MRKYATGVPRLPDRFTGPYLTVTLRRIERDVRGLAAQDCADFLQSAGIDRDALDAAAFLKQLAGQVNVTIHALGILICLPHILEANETVEYVSLGAGNTGRLFDLETDRRIAEFKFIRWRGGAETIRQSTMFKDFFLLAQHPTRKRKYLYLLGTRHALKFMKGGRALTSVLSRNERIRRMFSETFGKRFRTVGEYYASQGRAVEVVDVSPWLPELIEDVSNDLLPGSKSV